MFKIIACFVLIAVMRAVQRVCSKVSSREISDGATFFGYGTLYMSAASAFALVTLFITGFYGFNLATIVCSFLSALLFAADLFSSIEAIKGCSLTVASMAAFGGLVISVVVSYFWFGEGISIWQIAGLVAFFVAAYLLSPSKKEENKKFTAKTLIMLAVSFLSNGFVMVIQKYFSLKVENGNVALFSLLTFVFCALVMAVSYIVSSLKNRAAATADENEESGKRRLFKPLSRPLIICGLLLALALFVINLLITEMGKTVSSVVLFPVSSAIGLIVTALVGRIAFNEKLSVKNLIGLALGVAAIVVISVLTPENLSAF